MNILLCCPFDLESPGGVTTVVTTLAKRFREGGDSVAMLKPTWGIRAACATVDGMRHYEVPMRGFVSTRPWRSLMSALVLMPVTCWRLARILKRERIDVVNAHYFSDAWFYFVLLRFVMPFRLVVSVHGNDVQAADGPRHRRLLERWSPLVDRVVFCSDAFRMETFPVESGVYRKSQVILNGIAVDASDGAGRSERPFISCVAHLYDRKAPEVLVRAFHLLSREFPQLELDFVGDGPMRDDLAALARSLAVEARVNFRGCLPPDQAIVFIRNSQVMCLPSRREPFGLVVLEAMANGTPVVASCVGGIPEIVRDGIDGLLVPPERPDALAAALTRVLTDATLRSSIVAHASRRVAYHFTARRFADQYRAAFVDVCAATPGHRGLPQVAVQ